MFTGSNRSFVSGSTNWSEYLMRLFFLYNTIIFFVSNRRGKWNVFLWIIGLNFNRKRVAIATTLKLPGRSEILLKAVSCVYRKSHASNWHVARYVLTKNKVERNWLKCTLRLGTSDIHDPHMHCQTTRLGWNKEPTCVFLYFMWFCRAGFIHE